jgi:hypothetical protein
MIMKKKMILSRWLWPFIGWLIIGGLWGCNDTAAPAPAETAPVAATSPIAAPVPANTPRTILTSTATGLSQATTATPSKTPGLSLAALPLTQTQIIQGEKVEGGKAIPTPADLGLQGLVRQAEEDLAQRLGIAEDRIDLIELTFVTWPDKGLGCPRPGMIYPQVPEEGALIRLRAGKQLYDYHTGAGRPPFLCEK